MANRFGTARTAGIAGLLSLAGAFAAQAQEELGTVPVNESEAAPAALPAEGDSATELDTIEVTGSRIKRTDFETAQPVLSIGREDIQRTGLTSIGDLLQDLSTAGSALNTSTNNGGNGSVEVDLRGLGSQRVLVLVNGRRWVNGLRSDSSSSVDLNTIPISIIERVEVLKDGASAVYGSDAIAGVINIITRKNYQGAEFRSQAGMHIEGDGLIQSHSLSLGSISGATSVFADISYTKQEEVMAADRDFAAIPTYGTGITRGSSRNPQGRFVFVPDPMTVTHPCGAAGQCNLTVSGGAPGETREDGAEQSDFIDFNGALHRYNFAPMNYLTTPNERTSIFAALSHNFSGITFQGEALYNIRKSAQRLAETPIDVGDAASPPFNTLYVSESNPYNPFGQDIGRGSTPLLVTLVPQAGGELPVIGGTLPGTATTGSGVIFRRMTELGARLFRQDVDTYRLGGGFKGDFDFVERLFQWDTGFSFAESRNQERADGLVNLDRLRLAIGPLETCEATPGCVPVNLFGGQGVTGDGSITPDQLNYIAYTGQGSQSQRQRAWYAYLSNDLFDLPAGVVSAAYGLEYREEAFADTPDPLIQTSASSTNRALPTSGEYNVKEAYVEMQVPVLNEMFLVRALDLSLAMRYSKYNVFGDDTNYKVGLRWKPLDDLLVRGTVSTAFRAPSISNLYLGLSDGFPAVADPCHDHGASGTPEVQANCSDPANPANDGNAVPGTYQQANGQLLTRTGGNPDLTPEEADTYTAGIVYNPSWLPDLNVYLDWYRIDLNNAITSLGAEKILDNCYRVQPRGSTCDQIDRGPTGNINEIRDVFLNIGALNVSGIDVAADYTLPWRAYGNFKLVLDSAYLIEYAEYVADATGQLQKEGLQGKNRGNQGFPRWKANGTVQWGMEQWQASWLMRYIHSQVETCDDGGAPSLADLGLCSDPGNPAGPKNEIDAMLYHDVQVGYLMTDWDLNLTLGIKNLLDEDPPVSYSAFANSYDVTQYDVPGMFPYFRLQKSF